MMKEVYFIDGDNVEVKSGLLFANSQAKTYVVNQRGSAKQYKKISGVISLVPSCIGKEASDMMIGMKVMQECLVNGDVNRIGIVSNDGDMMDVLVNAAKEFPYIKFTQYHCSKNTIAKRLQKAILNGSLPSNVSLQRYRTK